MNIITVIEYLNKQYKYDLNGSYYTHVGNWKAWWQGFFKPFHQYTEVQYNNKSVHRELYSMKMAKKVCEDWASLLLNEKVSITSEDEAVSNFINDEVLTPAKFNIHGNRLIEKAFATGTGAIILRFVNMVVAEGGVIQASKDTAIKLEYLEAGQIIPLTVQYGEITECAFASTVFRRGKEMVYVEMHTLEPGGYKITNMYFSEEEGQLKPEPLPEGMVESFSTGSPVPLFCIIRPNIENNVDEDTALGVSVFGNAVDNLKGCDLAFNNFNRDFKLGGKKVFMNKELTKTDSQGITVTPDDVAQQLFVTVGDGDLSSFDEKPLIVEHNPALRVTENVDGIQAQLDYLSFKCGLGAKFYEFNAGSGVVTATQYTGERQDLRQNIQKQYTLLEPELRQLIRSIIWAGNAILGKGLNEDAEITIQFDDSYITDSESERQNDLQEVRDGIMNKWEYRVKWYGEDEAAAKAAVPQETMSGGWFGEE